MSKKAGIIAWVILLTGAVLIPSAIANITNDGNEAVEVEVLNTDGVVNQYTLYPGQTLPLGDDAESVTVPEKIHMRGDEELEVTIVEANGEVATITEYGKTYKLNEDKKKRKSDAEPEPGYATNTGNINVNITITRKNGRSVSHSLILEQTLGLPADTKEVKVTTNRAPRSDEIVNVEVLMPDGKEYTIMRDGGIVKMKEKKAGT